MQWGIEGDLDPVKRRGCMALFAALEQVLCHLFAVGQRNGEVSSERPALSLARTFLSSYYGLRLLGRAMPERAFLEDVMEGTLAQL